MATAPLAPAVLAFPAIPPMPAVARILARFDRDRLESFIAVAIDLLDAIDGCPDLEDDDPAEEADAAEEDDPAGMIDEDGVNTVVPTFAFPGSGLGHWPGSELPGDGI